MECFNKALLCNQIWHVVSNKNSHFSHWVTHKYGSLQDLFSFRVPLNASWCWKSLMWKKDLVLNN